MSISNANKAKARMAAALGMREYMREGVATFIRVASETEHVAISADEKLAMLMELLETSRVALAALDARVEELLKERAEGAADVAPTARGNA